MRLKRVLLNLLIICLTLSTIVFADSEAIVNSNEYNESLEKIGISYEIFNNMPEDKKEVYSSLEIGDITTIDRYYKIEELGDNVHLDNARLDNFDDEYNYDITEISKEQFLFEIENKVDTDFISSLSIDNDYISTSWVRMTTTLGAPLGNFDDRWTLSNDVTYIAANNFLDPRNTHIVGLSTGRNFSVLRNTDYLVHEYDLYSPDLGIYREGLSDYYFNAHTKDSNGYAYTVDILSSQLRNTMNMFLVMVPSVEQTTLGEGFGHYAKYTRSVSPSISFSYSGASMSISPTRSLMEAPNTHVQIRR